MTHLNLQNKPAIFFDRDGVLNIDKGYVYRKEDFCWVQGSKEAIKLAKTKGYLTFIITNQSGVARGFYTLSDMHELHHWVQEELKADGASFDGIYFCPYHNEGVCSEFVVSDHPDRKPNPGMILRAAQDHHVDLSRSLLIGDKPSDIEAAQSAGIDSILFQGGDLHKVLSDWFNEHP